MCEFCENISSDINMDLINNHNNFCLVKENKENCIAIVYFDKYDEIDAKTSTKINFCPMCGRDLRGK